MFWRYIILAIDRRKKNKFLNFSSVIEEKFIYRNKFLIFLYYSKFKNSRYLYDNDVT